MQSIGAKSRATFYVYLDVCPSFSSAFGTRLVPSRGTREIAVETFCDACAVDPAELLKIGILVGVGFLVQLRGNQLDFLELLAIEVIQNVLDGDNSHLGRKLNRIGVDFAVPDRLFASN